MRWSAKRAEDSVTRYVITGASSGLGRGFARALVAHGDSVWGVARRGEQLQELSKTLGRDRFSFTVCDVGRLESVRTTASAMRDAGFEPDVVVLNAGINPERLGAPFDIETFQEVLQINAVGALAWVHEFLPAFRARGRGQFVAISSSAAYRGDARWVAYGASKAALSRAFEALRGRHASDGLVFTTVHLGAVVTGMGSEARSPFRLTEKQAVTRTLAAIERGATSVTIPRYLRVIVEAMRMLPDPLFSRMVAGALAPTNGAAPAPARK